MTIIALLIYFFRFDLKNRFDLIFSVVLLAYSIFQIAKIFPYTSSAKYEVLNASDTNSGVMSIYTANVLQDNENKSEVFEDAERFDADILLFTETNKKWQQFLYNAIKSECPYKIEVILNNTYGMLL